MKIALLGGSFDPPHNGHLLIARQMLEFTDTDEVWFLPNYTQSPVKNTAPVADRLAMTRLLDVPGARVSTIEIDNMLDGETVRILPFLPKEHIYSFIIGSDQLSGFTKWLDWQKLLDAMPFWVFPRTGYSNEPMQNGMKLVEHKHLITTDTSSTEVRHRIQSGLPIDQLVLKSVASYIADHGLYTQNDVV